jgi:AraC-like DNA-binding protein
MTLITRSITLLAGLFIFSLQLMASQVTTLKERLAQYETTTGAARTDAANNLMALFLQEEFLEEPLNFQPTTPVDSINLQVWYWCSEYLYAHQEYQLALELGQKALPLCADKEMEANCLSLLSLITFRLSHYQLAADYAKRCYKLDEETGDSDLMSSSLNTLAGIYIGANQPQEAEKYILKGIELSKEADNPARQAVLLGMASEVYHAMGNDNDALRYINQACQMEEQLGRVDRLMVRLTQKASVLLGMHSYQEAEEVLTQTIPYLRQCENLQSLGIACNKMGMALLSQERESEAIPYYLEAADIFMKMGDMRNEMHARRGLYESYWTLCPDSAKIALERFNDLKDSLYSNATADSMALYNAEFGTDFLRQENESLARTRAIIIGCLVVAIILICVVWWYMRRRLRIREAALQNIIHQLQQDDDATTPADQSSDDDDVLSHTDRLFLNQLIMAVKNEMNRGNTSIETLASEMCVSRASLNRKVKQITGITAQQYVMRIRMEYARQMLLHSPEVSITEISCRCGFDDSTSFSRAFRRAFGVSPTQYREQQ